MSFLKDFHAEASELFDEATVLELAKILRLMDAVAVANFRSDLIRLCARYRAIIATLPCDLPDAPFNISLTNRADWLETKVIKPIHTLLDALGDDQRPMFSTWPYPLAIPEFLDHAGLQGELEGLLASSTKLRDSLRGQQREDAGHSQEFRQELFNAIAQVVRAHAPDVKPNRGVYDPELRYRRGTYVDAMRLIFGTVAGVTENLDRLIRGEINSPS